MIKLNRIITISALLLFSLSAVVVFIIASSFPNLVNIDGSGPLIGDKVIAGIIMLNIMAAVLCLGMILATVVCVALKKTNISDNWKWMTLDFIIILIPIILSGFNGIQFWKAVKGLLTIMTF